MTNVLPHEARSALAVSLRNRMILTGSFVGIIVAAVSALAALPTYLVVQENRAGLPPIAIDTTTPQDREARTEAARTRALITAVSPLISATSTAHSYIEAALRVKPSGISIDRIGYSSTEGLALSGTASKREDVNAYRAALSGDTLHFSNVNVPTSSLIGIGGGRFSMQLTLVK